MKKLLIVEDDEWMAQQLVTILAADYECTRAPSAYDAIEMIDHKAFDVLLLDIFLAGSNGLTLLHELQSYTDTAQLPVVVCSLAAPDVAVDDLAPYGVKALLDKQTVTPATLRRALSEAIVV